jgi:hypothetical protein
LELVVIFTSVENAKYFDEIINDFNNNENQKPRVKSVFIMNGNYDNYIPLARKPVQERESFFYFIINIFFAFELKLFKN